MNESPPGVVVFGSPPADFADGVAALRVLEAARRSARESRWVATDA